jgi:hypothetical protein
MKGDYLSRKKAVAGGIGALSALLVTSAILAPTAGATAHATSSGDANSAFAVSASGLLKINPLPAVNDSDGFSQDSVAEFQLPASLVDLKLLNARAGAGQARASIADLSVNLGAGKPQLSASAVEADCGAGDMSSSLAKAKIGDQKLDAQVPPNTPVTVPGVLSVTLNKQVKHDDGSVAVTAISINVDGIQKLDLASTTCVPAKNTGGGGTRTPAPTTTTKPLPNGEAPTPTPVKAHLDVTG